jgi:hypothetical protein
MEPTIEALAEDFVMKNLHSTDFSTWASVHDLSKNEIIKILTIDFAGQLNYGIELQCDQANVHHLLAGASVYKGALHFTYNVDVMHMAETVCNDLRELLKAFPFSDSKVLELVYAYFFISRSEGIRGEKMEDGGIIVTYEIADVVLFVRGAASCKAVLDETRYNN